MIPGKLNERLSNAAPFLDLLKKQVAATLGSYADTHNFPISGRVKAAQSVAEKIETGRYHRFSEIDDLVALTLIIPSANREAEVIEFCRRSFDVLFIRINRLLRRLRMYLDLMRLALLHECAAHRTWLIPWYHLLLITCLKFK